MLATLKQNQSPDTVSANLPERIGARLKSLFEEQAKKRQQAAGGDRKSVSANLREAIGDK